MNTAERIAAKALELFNEQGIEYVGMRELAAALNTKLGNITYYFPTKEDLILQVSINLFEANSAILQTKDAISIKTFLEMARKHYECQYQFRCIFLSFVHLKKQYAKLAFRYKKTEKLRKNMVLMNIDGLIQNKNLRKLSSAEIEFLLSVILLLSRFWISEAAISYNKLKPSEQIQHYIKLLANIILPFCTQRGKKEMEAFFDE